MHIKLPVSSLVDAMQVTRQQMGKGGVPYVATHDGRTIRYPDPDIRVPSCLHIFPHSIPLSSPPTTLVKRLAERSNTTLVSC